MPGRVDPAARAGPAGSRFRNRLCGPPLLILRQCCPLFSRWSGSIGSLQMPEPREAKPWVIVHFPGRASTYVGGGGGHTWARPSRVSLSPQPPPFQAELGPFPLPGQPWGLTAAGFPRCKYRLERRLECGSHFAPWDWPSPTLPGGSPKAR